MRLPSASKSWATRMCILRILSTLFGYLTFRFDTDFIRYRKNQKKIDKLLAMIPYHEGRRNTDEVEKIKQKVDAIWQKTREAAYAM